MKDKPQCYNSDTVSQNGGECPFGDCKHHTKTEPLCGYEPMALKAYPTRFEIMTGHSAHVAQVQAVDEYVATISIDSALSLSEWDELAPVIRECLVKMELL